MARLDSESQGRRAATPARFRRFHVDYDPTHLNCFDLFCDSNSEGLRGYVRPLEATCVLARLTRPGAPHHMLSPVCVMQPRGIIDARNDNDYTGYDDVITMCGIYLAPVVVVLQFLIQVRINQFLLLWINTFRSSLPFSPRKPRTRVTVRVPVPTP